ncbi:MAG: DUF5696 domain-containing protein [Limnochordia bacterium]
MQNRRMAVAAALLMILLLGTSVLAADHLSGFEIVAENEESELYFNAETVELAVRNKQTGHVWYTNHPERDAKETMTRGSSKDRLNSQIVITYYANNERFTMDSYNDAVLHGQVDVKPIPNGIRIDYELGARWKPEDYLPTIISLERFNEEILPRIDSQRDRDWLRGLYAQFSLEEGFADGDEFSILGVDLDFLLGDYGLKVEERGFRATDKRRLLQEYLVLVRDAHKYDNLGQIQPEEIAGLIDTPALLMKWNNKKWDVDDAAALFKAIGYTPDMVGDDHEQFGIAPPYPNLINFRVSVEYTLDGPDLIARVPIDSIVYPEKVYDEKNDKEVSYPMSTISLMPYFGSAESDSDGFIFIPDGSGAIIDFSTDKSRSEPYAQRVYGPDYATLPIREYSASLKDQIYFPVFGLNQGDRAIFGIIESGDAVARIEATAAGMLDSFYKVWASFDVRPTTRVNLEAAGELIGLRSLSINMFQSRLINDDIVVRYSFLDGEDAGYAGMARFYQNYLVGKHGLERIAADGKAPVILEVVGSIDQVKPVLGLPLNVVDPMTTFDQSLEIVDDLRSKGIENLVVRYLGWMRGGIRNIYPTKAPVERKVGTAQGLRNLHQELSMRGIELFPSTEFQLVKRNSLADSFLAFRHSSRSLGRVSAYINTHDISTYQAIDAKRIPILSPRGLDSLVDKFLKDYRKYDLTGLSPGSIGNTLYADYRLKPEELVDRQTAKQILVAQAEKMTENYDLLLEGAHAYLLPYAKYLVRAPLYSRGFEVFDRVVPFYPMVVSGYVGYAGAPYNLADRHGPLYVLKMLETGALPYFVVSGTRSSEVKNTDFNDLYSIYYQDLEEDILALYEEVGEVFERIWGQRIVDHKTLALDVYQTVYEDGTTIFVNYTQEDFVDESSGITIPAEGYVVSQ